jgi:hypothetical protein
MGSFKRRQGQSINLEHPSAKERRKREREEKDDTARRRAALAFSGIFRGLSTRPSTRRMTE